jgi:hypothetical protein
MAAGLAITVCVLATLYLGVLPGRVLDYSTRAAHQLMSDTASRMASLPSAATEP